MFNAEVEGCEFQVWNKRLSNDSKKIPFLSGGGVWSMETKQKDERDEEQKLPDPPKRIRPTLSKSLLKV